MKYIFLVLFVFMLIRVLARLYKREVVRGYRKAAEQGDVKAQYNLGLMYYKGVGTVQDKREAVRWYRKAAQQGNVKAQYNLGAAYLNGVGVIEDEREAYIWLSIARVNGDEDATGEMSRSWIDLTATEIKSAKREATQWLEAIDQVKETNALLNINDKTQPRSWK